MPGDRAPGLAVQVLGAPYTLLALPEGPSLLALFEHPAGPSLWRQARPALVARVGEARVALDEVRFDRSGRPHLLPQVDEPGVERNGVEGWESELPEQGAEAELMDWCATARVEPPETVAHPLQGAVVDTMASPVESADDEPPLKYRVAVIAGVTLLLGLATGWTMRPIPGGSVTLRLDETAEVVVDCGSGEVSWQGAGASPPLPAQGRCSVEARLSRGTTLSTVLDVASTGRYQCRPTEGDLTCFAL